MTRGRIQGMMSSLAGNLRKPELAGKNAMHKLMRVQGRTAS
jgi:hypothetical protein